MIKIISEKRRNLHDMNILHIDKIPHYIYIVYRYNTLLYIYCI